MEENNYGEILITWPVPEFVKHERNIYWYLLAGLATLGLLAYAIFTYNFFLLVIVILTAIILFVYHKQEPALVKFAITDNGLLVGQKFYPHKTISQFWVIYEKGQNKAVYFDFKGIVRPHLEVPLADQDPLTVREILLKYLEEDLDREEEPLLDALARWLKI